MRHKKKERMERKVMASVFQEDNRRNFELINVRISA